MTKARFLKLGFLRFCRLLGLFALARWHNRRKLLILCYHGFEYEDETQFRPKLYIDGDTFSRRLELIAQHGFEVLGLDDAVRRLYSGQLPDHSAVITIDDGFASVHDIALPVLQRHAMPATVYVTTYYVDKERPIFRLVVQYMFWKSERTSIDLDGVVWSDATHGNLATEQEAHDIMWECIHYAEQHIADDDRSPILQDLARRLDVDLARIEGRRLVTLMTHEEVRALANAGIDVQLHTHRHQFPPGDLPQCEQELKDNRVSLAPLTGAPLVHFCYPSGVYSPSQWQCLEDNGVVSATTCEPGRNDDQTSRYGLKRFLDAQCIDEIEFLSEISGFADAIRSVKDRLNALRGAGRESTAPPASYH